METKTALSQTVEDLRQKCETLEQQNAELAQKLKWFEEQFRLSRKRQFGASSEKAKDSEQLTLSLFNEAESESDPSASEPTVETITYKRKKNQGQRQKKLENLPVETIDYYLPKEVQSCSCCGGTLHEMTTEIREELKVIPAEVKVVKHVRHVYACRHCDRTGTQTPIITAQAPKPVQPKSLASPSAVAYTMCQKYLDAQPLYRQEQQFKRLGVALSRQTLANWILYGAKQWLSLIYERMKAHLMKQDILHADETTLQVLREPGRSTTSKSYLWLYRTGRQGPAIILYEYRTTRAAKHPAKFLEDFNGYLQVDGYAGYQQIKNVTLVGCWAHARRKFSEAISALPESAKNATSIAKEGLRFCNRLFKIERDLKIAHASDDERYQTRLSQSQPIVEAFSAWLQKQAPRVLPKSALGLAIKYCRAQWDKLKTFLQDGRLELDNNRAERSIKPFVIGRKNWQFSNTPRGATASAIVYSIIETAKENELIPFKYLTYLFEQLPNLEKQTEEALDELLPWSDSIPSECKLPTSE
ncbi:IS66 family transposase [Sporolactobacillus terrae]|uniref:Transposase n=1 Tax=Sporolactobacillus terrae TaxID=269673 RepID=A0A5K7X2P6_9BACL|nr:IS66 family transposase [Sporolactobacillus terrae]RYL96237.1 IS66 family transposase [Sporolactobacillus sp. THM7-7]BBN97852.1 transposase [Sporolactobacillus terrae]BBN98061.1 transposase [Sporolactobacillus terrae]BBO00011.1 transposase [Sporolactobacillus terrae]BBO00320.1 transposase [Sporolactobacillus terrae]